MPGGRPRKRRFYNFLRQQNHSRRLESNSVPLNAENQIRPDGVSGTVRREQSTETLTQKHESKIPLNTEQIISGTAIGVQESTLNQDRPNRASKLQCRQTLSEIAREIRLDNVSRASESTDEREQRLEKIRQRASMRRASESTDERKQRLEKIRQRASMRRASESTDERKRRLEKLRQQASMRRASESTVEREQRLEKIRQQASMRRALESTDEREQRLEKLRQQASMRLASESTDKREQRIEKIRQQASMRRALESTDERKQRLEKLRQQASMRLASESTDEREQRLEKIRQQASMRRALESTDEREQRLEKLRQQASMRLASESTDEREQRLEKLRQPASMRRTSESTDEGRERLKEQRLQEARLKDKIETMAVKKEENEAMEVDVDSPPLPNSDEVMLVEDTAPSESASDGSKFSNHSSDSDGIERPSIMNGNAAIISTSKLQPEMKSPAEKNRDLAGFFSKCSSVATMNYKQNIDSLMQEIKLSLKDVSSLIQQTEKASQKIGKFIAEKRPLFKTPIDSLKGHVKPRTYLKNITNNGHSRSILNSSIHKDPDGLQILETVPRSTNLPPPGELIRSHVDVGSRVWAMKRDLHNMWVKGTVVGIKSSGTERFFKIRLDNQKSLGPRPLSLKYLAYDNPAPVIVPVGTRIIARYTDSAGRSAHYAGIVAEPPKVNNNKRYLIFFDDGCAQYVIHEDIYVVCAQSVDVADDIHINIRDFVRQYLAQFPERPMVRLQQGQHVETEYAEVWSKAKVLEVDCSMVKMLFIDSQRIEWIYRGSTRLKPLCKELANAEAHRLEGKNRRRHNIPRKPHQPYIEYTREDIVVLDSDSDDDNKTFTSSVSGEVKSNKPKNTARKSLATRPFTTPSFRTSTIYHVTDKKSHEGEKPVQEIKSFVRLPFNNHDCGIHCREREVPAKYRGKNPLLIPILLGWERQLRKFRACGPGPKQVVTYRALCGRHLRNLQDVQDYLYLVKSHISIDFFSFDTNLNIFRFFRPKQVLYNLDDITDGKENVPVSCVNSLSEDPPPYLEYSAERFPGEGVNLNLDPDFLCGCDCTDNCQNPATCSCQRNTNYARYATDVGDAGYKFRRLKEPLVTGIYECNVQCKCNSQCGNRVVQNGISVRLQMFKTQYKGWGIRCLDDIEAGQFICVYAGQLLTEEGADADGKECGDEYLAELDHIEVVEKTKEGYESDVPELKMDVDENKTSVVKKDDDNENMSSDEPYVSSDSDVLFDSDSEFESSLRSTATSTYATRSRQKNGKRGSNSPGSASNNISEDSNSIAGSYKKDSKDLPDLSTDLEKFKIAPRPPSPESAEILEKIELKRKPKISEDEEMDISIVSPGQTKKELEEFDEKPKWESSAESLNSEENPDNSKCGSQRVVAKKSVSMKNTSTSFSCNPTAASACEQKENNFKSVRAYFGDTGLYIMDAKSKGNIGRYLNHSCEPNVFVQNVFVDTHDIRFPCIAFFAHDSIIAGTELTWDYNYEVASVADKIMYCFCEKGSCRGRLL